MRDRNAPLGEADIAALAWDKMDGLLPAVVQDSASGQVLMLGYMSRDSLAATLASGFATFFSRSKQRLWQKGETSGNRLAIIGVFEDCDSDALLVRAAPEGPTCHLGTTSCFGGEPDDNSAWLAELSRIVASRAASQDPSSYTVRLLSEDPKRVAQKVGEEGVELALAAAAGDRVECIEESADLLYHLAVLMEARGFAWSDVVAVLKRRHSV